jgi:hypothetical protein
VSDGFTEFTNQSWFGRLGSAIKGIIFGVILFLGAIILLFWNEGRAVKRYKLLKEGKNIVVSIDANNVDSLNEGKLVHVSGLATTDEILKDDSFGISVNAIKLKRNVEMYQWKEHKQRRKKKKLGGGTTTKTTYTYSKVWSKRLIDSSRFKIQQGHENPVDMPYSSIEKKATEVRVGAFYLSPSLIDKISGYKHLPAEKTQLTEDMGFKIKNGDYYLGNSSSNPKVGDVRVSFQIIKDAEVSLVSAQVGNSFAPYKTKSGGELELLEQGILSADEMFKQATESNVLLTWILRIVGFIIMFVGILMMFKVLSVVADVIPLLGSVVSAGTGIISFLIALILSSLTVAIAWITFRPLIAASLIILIFACVFLIKKKLKK